jgi:adenosine deaminase CECR1
MLPDQLENAKDNDDALSLFMPRYFFAYFLILYKSFYRQHIRNAFLQCIKDKQYRLESRLTPGNLRDENFNMVNEDEEFTIYKEELDYVNSLNLETKFTFGIIVEMIRNKKDEVLINTIKKAMALKKKYPDLICGMDLSGNENNFRTFQDLRSVMLTNDDQDLPWILHCGESIKGKNFNLVDGFLINSKRFGHCINLFKMGNLIEYVKKKGIILEINPVSNQTLKHVRDLRIHPCIGYHNIGIKITINNDDPTLYNTKGVNYDFLIVASSMEFDLLDFKCFGLNSIDGAQISKELKNEYKVKFLKNWDEFLDYFIKKYENK